MSNKFGIANNELLKIRARDKNCVYCHKEMIYPFIRNKQRDCATIEHLNFDGPFYLKDGLQIKDIVMCCGSCNSSRGIKKLFDWFKTKYCTDKNINENTVATPVKEYLKRKKYTV
ncbi:MAG: HNH endonuclease [Nanoarchaeota archaeon]|nr:HNH endonuclease [DPANN group archaeon]MBL7116538.1 HNH endonuclease [Nanoarchaeota archaeon]